MCGAGAAGQKVNVEKKGTYIYWLSYTDGLGAERLTQPERFKGKTVEIDVTAIGVSAKNAKIFVMDKRSGNLAIVDYKAPKDPKAAKPIDLEKDDFSYVRMVKLRAVSKDGQPLESGIMTLTDGEGNERSAIITPADAGVALFENVATGEINAKVKAKGATKTLDADFEISEDRDQPGYERDIKVAGDVDTIAAAKTKTADAKHAQPKTTTGAGLLQFLAGLIFMIILAAIIVMILRARGVTAKGTLQNLGVSLPEDQAGVSAPPSQPAVDPNMCSFCGQTKDAAGKCACSVAPGASPFAAPVPMGGGGPKLVGTQGVYAGHVFDLTGGSVTLGREIANNIGLPNDTTISRHHSTISQSGAEWMIRDENSSNGTFVNGARITEQKIAHGDEIQVGGTKFRFEG